MRREGHFEKGEVVYLALFLFSIFLLSIFQIKSYDLWWHLKAGEDIVGARHALPLQLNKFSWTEPDHPWINFSWLFDAIVYYIYDATGFNGLIVFQALLVTAVFFVVYKTILTHPHPSPLPEGEGVRKVPSPLWGEGQGEGIALIFFLFSIAYFAARFRFSLRPHLLALLIFAIDIYLLNKLSAVSSQRSANPLSLWERVRVRVPLIAIPLLQIIWANIHASAILGVLLPAVFAAGTLFSKGESTSSRFMSHISLTLLTFLASLINPFGIRILMESFIPFFDVGSVLNNLTVDEWQMPGKDMFLGWYGLLLGIGIISFFPRLVETPRRGVSTDLLLFATFALLSIKAVRFIDLFAVAAVPVIYKNVISGQAGTVPILRRSEAMSVNRDSPLHPSSFILHPFLILSLFWFIGVKDTTFTIGLGVDKEVIPKKAVDFMETNGIRGKMFNSYNFGGYLIYKGYPVFIDGRLCYSPELVKDFADANLMSGWKRVEEKYGPDIALVEYEKEAIPERLLLDKKNWALVYWDDLDMLFLKRSEKFSAIIAENEYRDLNPMDMYGQLPSPQPSPIGRGGEGEGEGRFAEAQRRIENGPDSMRAHLLLGNLYMNREELSEAISEYKAVIDSPLTFGKAEAHNNLGTANERVGDVYGAEEEYKAAIRLDKSYPLPQRNLGYLKLGQSEYIEAIWHLDRFLQLEKGDRNAWAIMYDLKRYRDSLILRVFIGGSAIIGIIWVAARQFTPSPSGRRVNK